MRVEVAITIDAPRPLVWSVVTDIENAAGAVSAIDEVEVLERPEEGLLGLKWKETRTIFGRTATETMWITGVEEGSHYTTEARSHGSIYRTVVRLEDVAGGTRASMQFSAEPTGFVAKFFSAVFGMLVARTVRKALLQDLEDLKRAAESRHAKPSGG